MGCAQNTAGRIINKVTRTIAGLRPIHMYMPQTIEQMLSTQEKFCQLARFPRVIGVIDCTHIKIQSPGNIITKKITFSIHFMLKYFFK